MIALLCLIGSPAHAWEVEVNANRDFRALFPEQIPDDKAHANEHARLAEDSLKALSPDLVTRYSEGSDDLLTVVDLNAWRRGNDLGVVHGDDDATPLEERTLPPLYMWSGLPDVGYSVSDWVNKLTLCPVLPPEGAVIGRNWCHEYGGWLGAVLNGTHWSSQAMDVYSRHHEIARARAKDAKAMRDLLQAGGRGGDLPDGTVFHADVLREAEQLALIYELTGSHFVQDRWSMGHTFNRWGAPSYSDIPIHPSTGQVAFEEAQAIGLTTGLIHGAGYAFGHPDPMNYPIEGDERAVTWAYSQGNRLWGVVQPNEGIGDGLYLDLRADHYDHEGTSFDISVANQRKTLDTCVSGGIREIIDDLGQHGGGYGIDGVSLAEVDLYREHGGIAIKAGFDPSWTTECLDNWATNDALWEGSQSFSGSKARDVGIAVKRFIRGDQSTKPKGYEPSDDWENVKRILALQKEFEWRANRARERDPNGTDLARNGFVATVNRVQFKPVDAYDLPEYFEPVDFSALPDDPVETGLDESTLYGFFNKAHSEHWCGGLTDELDELREKLKTADYEGREADLGACVYLAEKTYKGTPPEYPKAGSRFEEMGRSLPWDGGADRFGDTYEPICSYFEAGLYLEDEDETPYYVHPGYVANPQFLDTTTALGAETLRHWCESDPVVDWIDGYEQDGFGYVVGETEPHGWYRNVRLEGLNLGLKVGSTGAAGKAELVDVTGVPVQLDLYDPATGDYHERAWTDNGQVLDLQVPMSGRGFPSNASVGDLPHVIQSVEPVVYDVVLTRPNDPSADPRFQNDGTVTAGLNGVAVYPVWVEEPGLSYDASTRVVAIWVDYPQWMQDEATVLASGFYKRHPDGSTTALQVPFLSQVGGYWQLGGGDEVTWIEDADRMGILIEQPGGFDPAVWDGTVSYFFAVD